MVINKSKHIPITSSIFSYVRYFHHVFLDSLLFGGKYRLIDHFSTFLIAQYSSIIIGKQHVWYYTPSCVSSLCSFEKTIWDRSAHIPPSQYPLILVATITPQTPKLTMDLYLKLFNTTWRWMVISFFLKTLLNQGIDEYIWWDS